MIKQQSRSPMHACHRADMPHMHSAAPACNESGTLGQLQVWERQTPWLAMLHSGWHARVDEPLGSHGTLHIVVRHELLYVRHLRAICSSSRAVPKILATSWCYRLATQALRTDSCSKHQCPTLAFACKASSCKQANLADGIRHMRQGGSHTISLSVSHRVRNCAMSFSHRGLIVFGADGVTNVCPLKLFCCLHDGKEICRDETRLDLGTLS